jgi:E3 ubiquitin-protein ligase DOA10
VTLLSAQDGSVLDALLLWKRNVDKEFQGLEPCPICYSVLAPKTLTLPTLACQTCSNKFHPECLYKWFNSSHKSKCPLCQQPFNI